MANVIVGTVGKSMKEVEANTVGEAVTAYGLEGNFVVKVNKATASNEQVLEDGDIVTIGEKIKGGL